MQKNRVGILNTIRELDMLIKLLKKEINIEKSGGGACA